MASFFRSLVFATVMVAGTGAAYLHAQTEDVLRPKRPEGINVVRNESVGAGGQMQWRVGIEGGLGWNMMSRNISAENLPSASSLDIVRSSQGFVPVFGAFVDAGITDRVGLQLRLSYENKSVSASKNGRDTCTSQDAFGNILRSPIDTRAELRHRSTYIGLSPSIRFDIDERNIINFGASIQFRNSTGTDSLTWSTEDPDCSFYFADPFFQTKRVNHIYRGDVRDIRAALEASYTYREPLSASMFLYGTLRGQYFMTPWASNEVFQDPNPINPAPSTIQTLVDPQLHSLQLTIGLMWNL